MLPVVLGWTENNVGVIAFELPLAAFSWTPKDVLHCASVRFRFGAGRVGELLVTSRIVYHFSAAPAPMPNWALTASPTSSLGCSARP
jgi:hypothetical protein